MLAIAPFDVQSLVPPLGIGLCVVEYAILQANTSRVRDDQRAIVRRKAVEVAVGDRDHVRARKPLGLGNHALDGRMRDQVIGIVKSGIRLRAGSRSDPRIALPREEPLGLANLVVLHLQSYRNDGGAALFFERSKISRLPALGVEIPALQFAQRLGALPQPVPGRLTIPFSVSRNPTESGAAAGLCCTTAFTY